ncbi:MAG: 50S ribosomal protein L21 [Candidatus Shikimatogenerans bostrichidophilus]|nr:MAG: 50S ribosomal protein L21 [Candidatus Shikimatogenerans bostrichidophilus]
MYKEAIIKIGNHQYLIKKNKYIYINKLKFKENKEFIINKNILYIKDNNNKILIGKPYIKNFIIKFLVLKHLKDKKKIIFKKKKRKGYNIKKGHKQKITKIKVLYIKKIKNKLKYGT